MTTDVDIDLGFDPDEEERLHDLAIQANGGALPTTDPADLSIIDQLRSRLVHGDALDHLPDPDPLVEHTWTRASLALLYGPSGGGKTFLALDLACSTATGTPWCGRTVAPGPVLYIVAEGVAGMAMRRRAWMTHRHIDTIPGIIWHPGAINMMDRFVVGAIATIAQELAAVLVVIDTVNRCMVGGDENNARDMGLFVAGCSTIIERTGATVVAVHHTGKDESAGARGHSSLVAAADSVHKLKGDTEGFIELLDEKQKDQESQPPLYLRRITIGDSCVVIPGNQVADESRLSPAAKDIMQAIEDLDEGNGVAPSVLLKSLPLLPDRTLHRWIKKLTAEGLTAKTGSKTRTRYTLTDQGKQEVTATTATPFTATAKVTAATATPLEGWQVALTDGSNDPGSNEPRPDLTTPDWWHDQAHADLTDDDHPGDPDEELEQAGDQ